MMHARDFLEPGETALVFFTRGAHFKRYDDGNGTTGAWEVNPRRTVDRVIVYLRDDPTGINKLYLATYAQTRPSDDPDRYFVDLLHIQYAGKTDVNWFQFAGEGQKPFRYVHAEP